jgi:hypothetical protein
MSISFDNSHNCLLIARTAGMIQTLLEGLHTGSDEARDGASGVLCNVIYYNKEAARLVLGCDNVLSMLNGLCKSRDIWSKYLGVSVLEACCHQEHAVSPCPLSPNAPHSYHAPSSIVKHSRQRASRLQARLLRCTRHPERPHQRLLPCPCSACRGISSAESGQFHLPPLYRPRSSLSYFLTMPCTLTCAGAAAARSASCRGPQGGDGLCRGRG